jgi:hypothetical protein
MTTVMEINTTGQYMNSSLTREKFNHMETPRRRKKRQGNCILISKKFVSPLLKWDELATNLRQLAPVQNVASVKFKDKYIVNLRLSPDHAVKAEEQGMKDNQKIASIDLKILLDFCGQAISALRW